MKSKLKKISEVIVDYLKSVGADGLCCDDCGCGIDHLSPCNCINIDLCVPAKKYTGGCKNCNSTCSNSGETENYDGTCYKPLEK